MHEFSLALRAYQTYDPAGWVGVYRHIPMGLGILMTALGGFLLLFGSGRAYRLVAVPMGAVVGLVFAPVLLARFQAGVAPGPVSLTAAAGLGLLGLLFPPGAVFFAAGLPAGLFAGQLAGPADWLLGFVPGFLVCGLVAAVLYRHIGAVTSALVGSWVLVIGLLVALHQVHGISQALAAQPWGVIAAAGLFALAGTVYQLAVRPPPEELEKLKQEKHQAKQKASEQKALEKRWANYSANRNK